MRNFLSFPDPVNETAVRVTAAGVAVTCLLAIVLRRPEILVLVAYGFCARVLAGPRLSPLALLSTRVVTPRLRVQHRFVPGPPKRFAQLMGAVVSGTAVALYFLTPLSWVTYVIAGLMVLLATLEAGLRICVGCIVYSWLVRHGYLRGADCADCLDIGRRLDRAAVTGTR